MARVHGTALAFGIEGGHPGFAETRMRLVDPAPEDTWRLVVAVEPLSLPRLDAGRVAEIAIDAVSDAWTSREGVEVEIDLLHCFAAAHRALQEEREAVVGPGAGGMVGMSAMAFAGDEAVLVQSLPGRAILAGPSSVRVVPPWPEWDPAHDSGPGRGLGGDRVRKPRVEWFDLRYGDVLVLCDSGIGERIWEREVSGRPFRGLLAALTPASALDHLLDIAAEAPLPEAYALVLPVGPVTSEHLFPGQPADDGALPVRWRLAQRRNGLRGSGPPLSPAARALLEEAGRSSPLEQARLRIVEVLEERAGTMISGGRFEPVIAPAPGVRVVSRYNTPPEGYPDWRGRLPMLDGIGGGMRTLGFAVLAGALIGIAGFGYTLRQERSERAIAAVVHAQDAIAMAAANPAEASAGIAAAEAALAEARRTGAATATLRQLESALDAARDRAWGITRLDGMRRAGAIPTAIGATPVTLLEAGGRAYLAGHGLYEIDAASGQLVEVLAPGTMIGGSQIGPIIAAVSDRTGVTVSDGVALFQQDETGEWQRYPFGPGGNPLIGRPVDSFARQLYAISPQGSILRYQVEADGARSETWAPVTLYPDLASARHLAVNERIHVLLEDGTIDTFYEGQLEGVSTPAVIPAPLSDTFLAGAGDSGAIYIIDRGAEVGAARGRIIRYVPGGSAQQFLPPSPGGLGGEVYLAANAIANASQAVVIEQTSQVLLLSGRDLWVANLPPAGIV
jgi:hypothetical protein